MTFSMRGGWKPMVPAVALFLASCSAHKGERQAPVMKLAAGQEAVEKSLSQFPAAARERLEAVFFSDHFDGVIDSEIVASIIGPQVSAANREELMVDILPLAKLYSVPPISGFRVGAVVGGESGNLYFGANLEIGSAPLGFAIHAEQSAIDNALSHGEKSVRILAVTAAPCGHCRQFLNELTSASTLQVVIAGKPKTTLAALLPESFGPADLGVVGGLLGQTATPLVALSGTGDPTVESALRAASGSYSPYTNSYSGVAFHLKDGSIVAGSYVESAAYNPSLPPIVAAVDRLRFSGEGYSDISEAVLVELENPKVSQEGISRLLLGTLAPGIPLHVVKAKFSEARP
jgi:cytidine deaminase